METFSALLPFVRGIHRSLVDFPSKRPVTRSFDVFFDLRLNKRLSKQSRRGWFETQSRSLWGRCNALWVRKINADLFVWAGGPQPSSYFASLEWSFAKGKYSETKQKKTYISVCYNGWISYFCGLLAICSLRNIYFCCNILLKIQVNQSNTGSMFHFSAIIKDVHCLDKKTLLMLRDMLI